MCARPLGQTWTFRFTYGSSYNGQSFANGMPHLLSVQNNISSGENWTCGYEPSRKIYSPLAGNPQFANTAFLSVAGKTGLGVNHTFQYEPVADGYSGELSKVVFPLGGYLRWQYLVTSYGGSRTQREVSTRWLSADGTAGGEKTYSFAIDDQQNPVTRLYRVVADPGPVTTQKLWVFDTTNGRPIVYAERPGWTYTGSMRSQYTWAVDGAGNPYVASIVKTTDTDLATQKQTKTEQTVDVHGNVTQTKVYEYGSGTTPATSVSRTYTHTYLTGTAYAARHIYNRLTGTTLTAAGVTTTIAYNAYDVY